MHTADEEKTIVDDSAEEIRLKAENERAEKARIDSVLRGYRAPSSITEVRGCKVKATVLSIDPVLDSLKPETPCGKVPCNALIRIDQIINMGQLCAPFVVVGSELKAYFRFSLSKTDSLFPDMKQHFTGLEKSDTFAASFMAFQDSEGVYRATISGYLKSE